ncbi:ABC transporter ATP-binding protein [Jatrophihabitans sp. DSM 45814]
MLEIKNLVAGYGDTTVLRDVSLTVPESSVVALLGPNGAGKTTLLRVLSGTLKPRSGKILFDDVDITSRRPYQRAKLGICHIPEGRGIFPSLTVKENLILHSRKGEERKSIESAGDAFPILGKRLSQTAGSMSGGEQQMLALVRAYVRSPKLVLVDEASMGLAPVIVDQIFEFLKGIVQAGSSLLLVEQYVTRALALSETAYILTRGEIVFSGKSTELEGEDIFSRYLGVEVAAT